MGWIIWAVEESREAPVADVVYPRDEHGWEPGTPSIRAMAPSVVGGAVIPLAVYYLVHRHVGSDATALVIAGIPAAAFVLIQFARQRRVDPIGAIVLLGFAVGVSASYALGGNAFVLKVRESMISALLAIACLISVRYGRPVMFYFGRALSAGSDPGRLRAYNDLWELEPARRVFAIVTAVWGFGLLLDAGTRVVMALNLSTTTFLAVSPPVSWLYIATLFAFTVRFSKKAREDGEVELAEESGRAG